ncbi:uncharacterized protein BDV17DRAFT_280103 [Aspergillus undulatus]|uniref:uncharacterized protein n=1 Tax=Aspergillus undulatus TaxID=1810928 RepID=UPI003CCD06E8
MFSLSYGMPLSWRKQAHRPPGPFVEDEVDSLCRELDGSSHIGELSGFEGAKARGTVNQSPLILDIDTVHAPINAPENSSHDDERSPSGYRPSGFDANHHVPKTDSRQGPKQDPIRRPAGENLSQGPEKPRSKSPPRSQDTPSMSQTSRFAHTQIPDIPGSFPSTSQRPIPREPESASRAPAPHDALPPKLPPKPKQYMAEKSETVPSRAPSLPRGQEQRPSASPTRYTQPEPVREPVRVRMSSPAKSTPDVTEKSHTAHPRTPSVPRVQEQQKLGPPTRPTQSDPIRNLSLGTTVPTKPMSEMTEKRQTVSTSVPREREQQNSNSPTVYAHPERAQNRPLPTGPPQPVSGQAGHARSAPPQTFPSRPPPVPQPVQNRPLPTVLPQPAPIRDTSVRGPALPPKPMHEVTRQSQPTIPRPLPTPPDDEPCRPRPTSVPYQLETVVRDSGVRVEMLPPRSMPEAPQATQRPISVVSDEAQFKSFPSVIPPPRSLSETPPTLNTIPLQSMPLRSIPLHPLPNPPAEGPRLPSSAVKESSNLKQATSSTSTTDPRPNISGYMSGTAHTRPSHVPRPSNDTSARPVGRDSPPPGLTVAERLEEKLKYRREQREVPDTTQTASAPTQSDKSKTSDASASQSSERVGRSAQLPGAWPSDSPSEHFSSRLTQFPNLEPSSGEKKETSSQAKPPLKSALRSRSLDRSEPAATKAARRRTVAFAENPLEYPSQALDSDSDSNRSSSPNTGLTLSPCPRSIPVAGYQDWYTIDGLNHLDICPSCVKQMRKSKFRDRLVLATPKPRSEPISCAMSEPWTRLAWMQTLKKKFESLDLLLESCTGRTINKQHWYRIIDPETGSYLPQFNVCSACTFQRSTAPQERVCDFVSDSPRFIRYIDALDLASNRAEQDDTPPDLREFLAYARRKVVLRDCRRSRLIFDKWHYMPQLPEFTVCEDCYDDIDFSSTTPSSSREASCQLYSPRIRAKFNDAVRRDDLPFIKWMAITRFEAERRFRYRQDELLEDQRRGYDCSQDLRKNLEDWKRYE